ncbi:MAG: ankyrin repeat domain-containing protein [Pontiella sp.]
MNLTRFLSVALLSGTLNAHAQVTTNQVEIITQQEVIEAALYGKIATVETALKQGFKPDSRDPDNRTVLMYAAFNGQTAIAQKFIDAGADVNLQNSIGTSALMFAASAPTGAETVQLLLDNGAQINMVDNNEHFSALMWAAAEGQAENVKLLLKNNADTTLMDIDGDTAQSFAAKAGHTAVAETLKDATLNKKDK